MSSKQEVLRTRIVNFFDKFQDEGKKFTVDHFCAGRSSKTYCLQYFKMSASDSKAWVRQKSNNYDQKRSKTLGAFVQQQEWY